MLYVDMFPVSNVGYGAFFWPFIGTVADVTLSDIKLHWRTHQRSYL